MKSIKSSICEKSQFNEYDHDKVSMQEKDLDLHLEEKDLDFRIPHTRQ